VKKPRHPDYPHNDPAGYDRLLRQYLLSLHLAEHFSSRLYRTMFGNGTDSESTRRNIEIGPHAWVLRLMLERAKPTASEFAPEALLPQARAAFEQLIGGNG
jgi:hypothetical protein